MTEEKTDTSSRETSPRGGMRRTDAIKPLWPQRAPETGSVTRHFFLVRDIDVSGVSGSGRVAEGFVFADGTVALRWLTESPSTALYNSLEDLQNIHGHNGLTRVVAAADYKEESPSE